MKKMLSVAAIIFLLASCTTQIKSPLVDVEGSLSLPGSAEQEDLRVVYPAGPGNQGGGSDSLTRLYGPDWADLQDQYPEYRFNGER